MEMKKPGYKLASNDKPSKKAELVLEQPQKSKTKKEQPQKTIKFPKVTLPKGSFFTTHKKPLIITAAVIALAGLGIGVFFLISSLSSNESRLESDLTTLGRDFYQNYYYNQLTTAYEDEKLTNFLAKYKETGIKVNLDNLSRYPSETLDNAALTSAFKNSHTNQECDKSSTKVTIYPESPFGRENFRIESELSCGFDS